MFTDGFPGYLACTLWRLWPLFNDFSLAICSFQIFQNILFFYKNILSQNNCVKLSSNSTDVRPLPLTTQNVIKKSNLGIDFATWSSLQKQAFYQLQKWVKVNRIYLTYGDSKRLSDYRAQNSSAIKIIKAFWILFLFVATFIVTHQQAHLFDKKAAW